MSENRRNKMLLEHKERSPSVKAISNSFEVIFGYCLIPERFVYI